MVTPSSRYPRSPVSFMSLCPYRDFAADADDSMAENFRATSLVCFTRSSRSWDFMLPDVVRPVASTTIGDLVSLVHRMRLSWIDFKPDEGIICAAGHGRSISASRVRGLGLFVKCNQNGTRLYQQLSMMIPSRDADQVRKKKSRVIQSSCLLS